MSALQAAAASGIDLGEVGIPAFDRRLTDKILAAFNHAFAVGELEVAEQLHQVLAIADDHERARLLGADGRERRSAGALAQAALWVAYVEARNSWQAAAGSGLDDPEAAAAFEAMKRAYRRWSHG